MATTTFVDGTTLTDDEWFNDTDAVVYDILGSPTTFTEAQTALGNVFKRKSILESIDTTTTLQDDDDLTFAIGANEEWVVSYHLSCGAALNNTGVRVAITAPSGYTMRASGSVITSGDQASGSTNTSGSAFILMTTSSSGATGHIDADLWVLNGATPGNIVLQWAQGTSHASSITFNAGCFLVANRIA